MDIALQNGNDLKKTATIFMAPAVSGAESEARLWALLKAGDREALNILFEKHAGLLYSYGRNMTHDQDLIADCIQDLFIELWVRRQSIADVRSVKSYLIKSIRRRILRKLCEHRKRNADNSIPEDYSDEIEFSIELNIIHDQTAKERNRLLKAAIAQLGKHQREAIYLKFYENMSYEELASVMAINVKAAYNLIGKAIRSLRTTLKHIPVDH